MVRLANSERFPIVPYGGGTGVAGAVTPLQGGIAVDMRRMNRILEISLIRQDGDGRGRCHPGRPERRP